MASNEPKSDAERTPQIAFVDTCRQLLKLCYKASKGGVLFQLNWDVVNPWLDRDDDKMDSEIIGATTMLCAVHLSKEDRRRFAYSHYGSPEFYSLFNTALLSIATKIETVADADKFPGK